MLKPILGHDQPFAQLLAASQRGRMAHAYLFLGPEGIGKRTFALRLAQALLCERPPSALLPCGTCPACLQVEASTHPDCVVRGKLEDKSELSIDVIRDLLQQLAQRPMRGHRKIVILDDVDLLNDEAANSFLKTLEEPPAGSLLILIGTSMSRQLPTILSRCQIVRFQPLPEELLRAILHEEHPEAVNDTVLSLARGSVSQALMLADPELSKYLEEFHPLWIHPRPDVARIARSLIEFVESVGKDAPAQRSRSRALLILLLDLTRQALLGQFARDRGQPMPNWGQFAETLAEMHPASRLLEVIESLIELDIALERRLQIVLLLEQLAERLAGPSLSRRSA